ncbi:MAG: class I SAM-dependent methyltransferase [Acidobacteria bacterium]|nr:class I SAM-dependent methyltransferase [Acidobacteriota bacterium]
MDRMIHGTGAIRPEAEDPRSRPLRARRLRAEDLKLALTAQGTHGAYGAFHGPVEDLSNHGVAVLLKSGAGRSHLFLCGDRVESLAVHQELEQLHRGAALVRRLERRGSDLLVGLELDPEALDLSGVYHLSSRTSARERWQAARRESAHEDTLPEFRAWLFDLRMHLETAKQFLDMEERGLDQADLLTRRQARQDLLDALAPEIIGRMDQAGDRLRDLVDGLDAAGHEAHRRLLRQRLVPLLSASPFLRRAFDKPLGYAGDFEMMNMLYRDHAEGESLFGQALNIWATQTHVAQANINRLELIGRRIHDGLLSAKGRLKVMSIGCGPAREVQELLHHAPELGRLLDVGLIDQGEGAIAHCESVLAPLAASTGARFHFHRESIRRFLTVRESERTFGKRNLIYSGGLFDYLGDRAYKVLLQVLYDALVPGGRLLLGNVAAHNPSRWAMEYFVDWMVIHRSAEELRALASHLKPKPSEITIEAEPSGVNLFLHVMK